MYKGRYPKWAELLDAIELFGVEAVLGKKTLSANEIRAMMTAKAVINAYRARDRAKENEDGWAGWAKDNPKLNELLNDAKEAAREDE